jgi:hypothetical protein
MMNESKMGLMTSRMKKFLQALVSLVGLISSCGVAL